MLPFIMLLLTDAAWSYPVSSQRVDLSHVIDNTIPRWPTFKALTMRVVHDRRPGNFTVQTESMETVTHIGTHVDAPIHFIEGGRTIDQIPQEQLSGPAVVIDVQNQTEHDPSYKVSVEDLERFESEHGPIPPKGFVLLHTGLGRYWNNTKKYLGTDLGSFEGLAFPGLSGEAADWLVTKRDILGVGLDTVSLDAATSTATPAHLKILGADKIAIENVANLDKLPPKGIQLDIFPLRFKGAGGAPAQVNAYFETPVA